MKILLIEERKKHLKEDFLINTCTIFLIQNKPGIQEKASNEDTDTEFLFA